MTGTTDHIPDPSREPRPPQTGDALRAPQDPAERPVTRRTGLRAAAALAVAAPFAATAYRPSRAQAAPTVPTSGRLIPGEHLRPGRSAFIDVTAATLWREPRIARPRIDDPSLTNPVDLRAWNQAMEQTSVRRWLAQGLTETQALLGTRVIVDDIDGDWAKILVPDQPTPRDSRGYPGWVPAVQLVVSDEFARAQTRSEIAVVTAPTAWLSRDVSGRSRMIETSINTELPVLRKQGKAVQVTLPDGARAFLRLRDVAVRTPDHQPAAPTGADLLATAQRFLGLRYLWAGVSAFGFDCSGFTYSVCRAHGIIIPRDAGPQRSAGDRVGRQDLQVGDLVFFAKGGGEDAPASAIHHVAFWAGDGLIMHSPNSASSVEITPLGEFDSNREYAGAVRLVDNG
ncbi:C40 family peptidase [Devriesea agamarum]|uniref:C40 family peptidase n=1 Tax=Devriesea agamarum TaxID=472569 RepID=UPI000A073B46|nr:C40 family peptidase [Devriesea agamarum]